MTSYGDKTWFNIGSNNVSLPDNKLLFEPLRTYRQWDSMELTLDQFHRKCIWYQFIE